ncbi:MAG: M48 family metalloprotease [Gammaproteobacteria bacterium]|nr:M48 family metalloprotease [Gammaproteobacteria bacterium]
MIGLASVVAGTARADDTDEVIKHFGYYDDSQLQAYVQKVGERVAQHSDEPNRDYRFTVLDSADVNAFTLPSGDIFITRGLLAYLNSEAELAGVLGHEIGHVTARHISRQQTASAAANLGYLLGSIFVPQLRNQGAQQLFNVVGGAVLSGYGREHELEADRLGARFIARSGYDPQAVIDVLTVLKNQETFERQLAQEQGRQPRVYHGLFASHPDNDTRLQQVVAQAGELENSGDRTVNRAEFIRHLDGLTFGDSAREGVRRGNEFYHGELGFALTFPEGWRVENLPNQLVAQPPGGDAVLQMGTEELIQDLSPRQFMLRKLKLGRLQQGETFEYPWGEGYTALATTRTQVGPRLARFTVLYFRDKAYVFAGVTKDANDPYRYDGEFIKTAQSFRALTDKERRLAEPLHLKVIRAHGDLPLLNLSERSRIPSHALEQLQLLNHLYPDGEPQSGDLIKIVE